MFNRVGFGNAQFHAQRLTFEQDRQPVLSPSVRTSRADLLRLQSGVISLRRLFESLETELSTNRSSVRAAPAFARSSSDLGIDPVGSSTTLISSEEVNTTPTSYSPFGSSFSGPNAPDVTITGVYDGSNDTDTLTFTVKKTTILGRNRQAVKVDVTNSRGDRVDRFTIAPNTPAGTPFTLDNGLIVSFDEGRVFRGSSFDVDVNADVGSAVAPDRPFDGTRNDIPNFEYGTSVTAGSFEVNGVAITVNASDTLNDVLSRITDSAAGVTATFDAETETVRLTHKSVGPSHDISVGSDTSNFLRATKLAGATVSPGSPNELEEAISRVPGLAGVTRGTATINGVSIAIDPSVDTLNDVLARINDSAGVAATFSDQRVSIRSLDNAPLVLDDGDTGIFRELRIASGTYSPREERNVGPGARRANDLLTRASTAVAKLFGDPSFRDATQLSGLRAGFQAAVRSSLGESGQIVRTDFGVFDFRESSDRLFEFRSEDKNRLRSALNNRPGEVRRMFLEPRGSNDKSLLGSFAGVLETAEQSIRNELGSTGSFIDVFA